MKKSTLTVFFILAGCMLFLSGIWIYFQKNLDQVDLGEGEGATGYEKHYLMISGEENTLMWDSIYESASAAAKDADAYVELITPGHDDAYTKADYLRIGIASQVDGIILEADGSCEEQELIQEAADENIPVVTVLTDDSSSARISFVGLNSYQLGNAYTEQILGLLKEHTTTQVLLLSNSQSKTQETNLIYYQIKKELEEKKKDYQIQKVIMDVVSYQMTDTDMAKFKASLDKTKTDYLVVHLEQNCHDYLRQAGCIPVAQTEKYVVYRYGE